MLKVEERAEEEGGRVGVCVWGGAAAGSEESRDQSGTYIASDTRVNMEAHTHYILWPTIRDTH